MLGVSFKMSPRMEFQVPPQTSLVPWPVRCFQLHEGRGGPGIFSHMRDVKGNKSDISYLKTSLAFDVLIHSGKPNSVG